MRSTIQTVKLEAFLIQVVVVGNLPAQPGFSPDGNASLLKANALATGKKSTFWAKGSLLARLAEARQQ